MKTTRVTSTSNNQISSNTVNGKLPVISWVISSAFLLVLAAFSSTLFAQQITNDSQKSYLEARKVLSAGVKAMGGQRALDLAQGFSLKMSGTSFQIFAGYDPELPFVGWSVKRTATVDVRRNRLYGDEFLQKPNSNYVSWTRYLVNGEKSYDIIMDKKWAVPAENASPLGLPKLGSPYASCCLSRGDAQSLDPSLAG